MMRPSLGKGSGSRLQVARHLEFSVIPPAAENQRLAVAR
jgi:hypothetical protein